MIEMMLIFLCVAMCFVLYDLWSLKSQSNQDQGEYKKLLDEWRRDFEEYKGRKEI